MPAQSPLGESATDAALRLHEEGLTLIPLGSPFEAPPQWFVNNCKSDDEAREKWPKTPRIKWGDYQTMPVPDGVMQGWLRTWPECNWAILTGKELVVIDADNAEAMAWCESGAITRPQRWVDTAKGRHYYFARGSIDIRNSVGKSKIDMRGHGGYVVAPGSVHATGVIYAEHRNADWPDASWQGLPPLTGDDIDAINRFNGGGASTVDANGNLNFTAGIVPGAAAPVGQRNATLAASVGSWIRRGDSLADIMNKARGWNESLPAPLGVGEVERTAASIVQTHLKRHPDAQIAVAPVPILPEGQAFFGHVAEFLAAAAPIDWLVKRYWPRDSVAMLFGESGAGKSFVAIDLAASVAAGVPWMGQRTKQGAVFYIAGEGENGMGRRFLAWQIDRKVSLADAPLFISHASVPLMDRHHAEQLQEIIQTMAGLHQAHPQLIVIDTLARNFGAGDESSNADMGAFVDHVTNFLCRPFGACVCIVHHTGHGAKDRARGAYSLPAGIDVNFKLQKTETGTVELTSLKAKESADPKPLNLALVVVDLPFTDDEGEPETSCVPQQQDIIEIDLPSLLGIRKPGRGGGNKQHAYHTLENLYALHQANHNHGGLEHAIARVLERDWRIATDLPRNRFLEVRDALTAQGAIRIEGGFVYLTADSGHTEHRVGGA